MRHIELILIVIMFFFSDSFSQNTNTSININDFNATVDSIMINIEILYTGNSAITIYKPTTKSICYGILKFEIVNIKTNEKYEILPCDEIGDLDQINLNFYNAILLRENECFSKVFMFSIFDISDKLQKGDYYITAKHLLYDVNFKTDLKYLFKENLISRPVYFTYEF